MRFSLRIMSAAEPSRLWLTLIGLTTFSNDLPQKIHSSLTSGICAPQNGQSRSSSLVYDFRRSRYSFSIYSIMCCLGTPSFTPASIMVSRSNGVRILSLRASAVRSINNTIGLWQKGHLLLVIGMVRPQCGHLRLPSIETVSVASFAFWSWDVCILSFFVVNV